MKKNNKPSFLFKILKYLLTLVYLKIKVEGLENVPDEPCIIVANHAQMHGPVSCELYLDDRFYTWCAGQMMNIKEVPSYAYKDFWSAKPKVLRPFFKLVSYIIAPLCVVLFNNARTVGVYRDMRILKTFRESVKLLMSGKNLIIFPEHYEKHNNIIYDFQEKFIDIADIYYNKTGKEITFIPLYVAPDLKKICFGEGTHYSKDLSKEDGRKFIKSSMMQKITDIALSLPPHTVVPYPNVSRKHYPKSKEK